MLIQAWWYSGYQQPGAMSDGPPPALILICRLLSELFEKFGRLHRGDPPRVIQGAAGIRDKVPRWPFGFWQVNFGPTEPWLPFERSNTENSRRVVDAEASRAAACHRGSP